MDLLSSKTGPNRREHHTDLYCGDELIIRRGQTFQMELGLNRPFSSDTDKLRLELKTGTRQINDVSYFQTFTEGLVLPLGEQLLSWAFIHTPQGWIEHIEEFFESLLHKTVFSLSVHPDTKPVLCSTK